MIAYGYNIDLIDVLRDLDEEISFNWKYHVYPEYSSESTRDKFHDILFDNEFIYDNANQYTNEDCVMFDNCVGDIIESEKIDIDGKLGDMCKYGIESYITNSEDTYIDSMRYGSLFIFTLLENLSSEPKIIFDASILKDDADIKRKTQFANFIDQIKDPYFNSLLKQRERVVLVTTLKIISNPRYYEI